MRVLALDTATTDLVTGLVDPSDPAAPRERIVTDTRAHNEQLVPTVEALLADASLTYADLDALAVGCGPGPFTGLRVGMATAQAFGQALGIPVVGVCSHDAIAHQLAALGESGTWLIATDARRKEVYWATYELAGDGVHRLTEPSVSKPEALAEELGDITVDHIVIPEAIAPRLPEALAALPREWDTPRPAGLVAAAAADAASRGQSLTAPAADVPPLVPLYLRRPDAVPPKPTPRSAALPPLPQDSSEAK